MAQKSPKHKPGLHVPILVASFILTLILMVFAIISISKEKNQKTGSQVKSHKVQNCPDGWYINRMPDTYAETDDMPNEYMVYQNQRVELTEVDVNWIKANCPITEPQPVY